MSIDQPFAELPRALAGGRFSDVRFVAEATSTNELIAPFLGNSGEPGVTIVTDFQHRGAGRKGREWLADPGSSLLFTTAIPDPIAAAHVWAVPFWAALAVRDALRETGIEVCLQWPNDILVGSAKLCGILCLSRVTGALAWAACGIGINVHRPREPSAAIVPTPAFVADLAPISRESLLENILRRFEATLPDLRDPQAVARNWESAAGLPGARYRILVDGETQAFEATALSLARDGALVVESNGTQREISLADARVLR